MLKQLIFFLLFLAYFNINGSAQEINKPDWQIFWGDSLIINGNYNTNNASRPLAIISFKKNEKNKIVSFVNKTLKPTEKELLFKENDTIIQRYWFHSDSGIKDTLKINFVKFNEIFGKKIMVYYQDNKFQPISLLLGTLIFKKD